MFVPVRPILSLGFFFLFLVRARPHPASGVRPLQGHEEIRSLEGNPQESVLQILQPHLLQTNVSLFPVINPKVYTSPSGMN